MTYNEIKSKIRSISKTFKQNRKCFICGEKGSIENHHLLRVADLSKICITNKYFDIESLYIPTEDLCSNHHKKWHDLVDNIHEVEINGFEYDRYFDLLNRIVPVSSKIPYPLIYDYICLY